MNKAIKYRLELILEGVDPDAQRHAMKGDGWRLLATVPRMGKTEKPSWLISSSGPWTPRSRRSAQWTS